MISVADTNVPKHVETPYALGFTLYALHFTVLASLSYVRCTAHIYIGLALCLIRS